MTFRMNYRTTEKSLTAVKASKHRMFEAKNNNTDCLKQ